VARKTEARASAKTESGLGREEQEPVAEWKILGPARESAPCRRRDDLRSRRLQDGPVEARRSRDGCRHVMCGARRLALAAEEATEGMTHGMANARACRSSGRTARREPPTAAVSAWSATGSTRVSMQARCAQPCKHYNRRTRPRLHDGYPRLSVSLRLIAKHFHSL